MKIVSLSYLLILILSACGLLAQEQPNKFDAAEPPPIECLTDSHTLLLEEVVLQNVRWRNPSSGEYGCGVAIPHRRDSGHFWFFSAENIELTCKALDGSGLNGQYWIFCGALTNVEWWLDAVNNPNPSIRKRFYNPPSQMASFADTSALQKGENRSARIRLENAICGNTYLVPTNASGYIRLYVNDPDLDNLEVSATFSGLGIRGIQPQWTNPVNGIGALLELWFDTALEPAEAMLTIEVSDQKQLKPVPCVVKFMLADIAHNTAMHRTLGLAPKRR